MSPRCMGAGVRRGRVPESFQLGVRKGLGASTRSSAHPPPLLPPHPRHPTPQPGTCSAHVHQRHLSPAGLEPALPASEGCHLQPRPARGSPTPSLEDPVCMVSKSDRTNQGKAEERAPSTSPAKGGVLSEPASAFYEVFSLHVFLMVIQHISPVKTHSHFSSGYKQTGESRR